MSNNDKTGTVGQTSDQVSVPHTVDEVVPSSTPLTIPYLEIYRTNELEYVEYQSPYLNQGSTSDEATEEEESDENESLGGSTSKTTKQKLWTALSQVLIDHYPKLPNKDYWIGKLISADVGWTAIAKYVNQMGAVTNGSQNQIIERVLSLKERYTHTDRKTYPGLKNQIIQTGRVINKSPKAKAYIKAMQNSNGTLSIWGDRLDKIVTISEKYDKTK